uniref:Pre-mRNA-splicing factor 18 n=1 Tax=Glossina austeni TaxID=7395 RepID=A0A1A9VIE7_GLOAU
MGGSLSQFATLRSDANALKETGAKQKLGVQAPIIDEASNVLCEEGPKRQKKNKRPKATARKSHNCDRVWHIVRECKFRRKDSDLRLPINSKAGEQHKSHIKGLMTVVGRNMSRRLYILNSMIRETTPSITCLFYSVESSMNINPSSMGSTRFFKVAKAKSEEDFLSNTSPLEEVIGITKFTGHMLNRNYTAAGDAYLEMVIGNAPWPTDNSDLYSNYS